MARCCRLVLKRYRRAYTVLTIGQLLRKLETRMQMTICIFNWETQIFESREIALAGSIKRGVLHATNATLHQSERKERCWLITEFNSVNICEIPAGRQVCSPSNVVSLKTNATHCVLHIACYTLRATHCVACVLSKSRSNKIDMRGIMIQVFSGGFP
jgi:hypothetical protein